MKKKDIYKIIPNKTPKRLERFLQKKLKKITLFVYLICILFSHLVASKTYVASKSLTISKNSATSKNSVASKNLVTSESLNISKTYKVRMLNKKEDQSMLFEPAFLKIKLGDTVQFVSTDPQHNSQSVFIPKGAKKWKSPFGKTQSVQFTKEGVYIYECEAHTAMGMIGVIQVGQAKNLNQINSDLKKYKKKVIMNQTRLDELIKKVRMH